MTMAGRREGIRCWFIATVLPFSRATGGRRRVPAGKTAGAQWPRDVRKEKLGGGWTYFASSSETKKKSRHVHRLGVTTTETLWPRRIFSGRKITITYHFAYRREWPNRIWQAVHRLRRSGKISNFLKIQIRFLTLLRNAELPYGRSGGFENAVTPMRFKLVQTVLT